MKRFVTITMSAALGAVLTFGAMQGTANVLAAQNAQTSSIQQDCSGRPDGPGKNDGTRAGGQVASVSDTAITVTGRDSQSQSILITSSTTYDLDGKTSSLSAIAAGQFIRAEGTTDSAGAFTATAVHASTTPPQGPGRPDGPGKNDGTRAGGQVASVSATAITVTGRDSQSQTIQITGSTTYDLDGTTSSLSAIAAGQFIRAEGTTDSAG
ncbi:MAG: DUF5666 domain-containing protein, partial [Chloroflexales bacterium]